MPGVSSPPPRQAFVVPGAAQPDAADGDDAECAPPPLAAAWASAASGAASGAAASGGGGKGKKKKGRDASHLLGFTSERADAVGADDRGGADGGSKERMWGAGGSGALAAEPVQVCTPRYECTCLTPQPESPAPGVSPATTRGLGCTAGGACVRSLLGLLLLLLAAVALVLVFIAAALGKVAALFV